MQNFTTKIVDMMKSESLYASQGGPIILSQVNNLFYCVFFFFFLSEILVFRPLIHLQIENEYENLEANFEEQGRMYARWAANMAVGLDTGVPWVMCKQKDAPDPVVTRLALTRHSIF